MRTRAGAFVAGVTGAFVLLCAAPATAGDGFGNSTNTPPSSGSTAQTGACVLYANAAGFGADCVAGSGGTMTVAEMLDGDPFPGCRYEDPPPDVLPPDPPEGQEGYYLVETCLVGYDPAAPLPPDQRKRVVRWFFVPKGTPRPPELTPNQQLVWNIYRSTYPTPFPQFGPARTPRALIWTYLWLGGESGRPITKTVWNGARMVTMTARVEQTLWKPGYDDTQTVTCAGAGLPYNRARDLDDQLSDCRYEYARSSAIRDDDTFDAVVEAVWVVTYEDGGGERELGRFPVAVTFETEVEEIQAVSGNYSPRPA